LNSALTDIKVIDADTHVIEPPDLWTSRVSTKKWGNLVPHVRRDPDNGDEFWYFGDHQLAGVAKDAMAGWNGYAPTDRPRKMADADPATWDPVKRLARMDEYGIYAQVLYPNVAGPGAGYYLDLKEPELMLDCARAYNDFLTDYSSVAPDRFIAVTAIPFWDIDESIREIRRCAAQGHRGVICSSQPDSFGLPDLADSHWDPIWAEAQDLELSINFHIASGNVPREISMYFGDPAPGDEHAHISGAIVSLFLGNARAIAKVIHGGVCHRFPSLNFVSVESGIGWLPFVLESLDWQWKNNGVHLEHPEYDLLPSEYFRRQIYGMFWFEEAAAKAAIDILGPDNIMYETDFPHPTSMSPGPASSAVVPKDFIADFFADFELDDATKILHDNAARIYKLT
jgi:predicted TIM-barrel fold metal-dependent hydrolase